MNDQGENHTSVGAALFEYCHVEGGSRSRVGFEMRVGDNPDFWKARLLMPGAEFQGICYASFDSGVCEPRDEWPSFDCALYAGTTLFNVEIKAKDRADARKRCQEIGGLRVKGQPWPSRVERLKLALQFLWRRRPTIRLRSPLDMFNR